VGAEEFSMKIQFECAEHGLEDVELGEGFAMAVIQDEEGHRGKAIGARYPAVVHWLQDEGLHRILFADDADEGAHIMKHLVDELMDESATENGHSDVEQVDAAEEEYHVGYEESIGPTDAELDAWLTKWFGEDKQPLPGHKFNRAFARELIEFGRSFT
jgi:hypothetical protein